MRLLPQTHCLEEEEKQKTKIESQPFRANGLSISYRRRSLRKARVSLPQRPESVNRGPRGVPDAPSTRGKKLSKKLGRGAVPPRDQASSGRGQARANFPWVRPHGSPGRARRAATSSSALSPRGASRRPLGLASTPRRPGAPKFPGGSSRPESAQQRRRAPRAHPRRPLLGDRGS